MWKTFIELQPFPTTFYHRTEFRHAHAAFQAMNLPLILVEKQGRVEVLLLADEIKDTSGLMSLINLVQSRLDGWRPTGEVVIETKHRG